MKHMLRWFYLGPPGSLAPLTFLLAFSGYSLAQPSAHAPALHTPTPRERTLVAESFTAERLWVWQKRLNLKDWNIAVVLARTGELKPKTLGNIHWDAEKKSAVIRVLDPADYRLPFRDMLKDMEFTVVHELIHLELSSLPRSDASRRDEEHAVNQIAEALLKLDHSQ
jgi:hypothetical protein